MVCWRGREGVGRRGDKQFSVNDNKTLHSVSEIEFQGKVEY